MPAYDYKCLECGEVFEVHQRMSDPDLQFHVDFSQGGETKCQGVVTKVIGAPAIVFRGSGFYQTDYKDKGI